MSVEDAFRHAGVPADRAAQEAPAACAAMVEFEITTQARAEMFLAQVLHESGGLRYFEEIASGAEYEGRKDLGNIHPGDGRRYKGRGPIQLTGRSNYRWAGKALGVDLEGHPLHAAAHPLGWRIAGLYWRSRGLNELADRGAFIAITERINGGRNGLATRQAYLARVRQTDCRPKDRWAGFSTKERRWIHEYDRLHRAGRNPDRQLVLQRKMTEQRKRIWQAAQGPGGWATLSRKARYHALLLRTRPAPA